MGDGEGCVDLLVVGGGITGAGIAQDAAARGLRVVLVEKGDFASGTSSRSSKLVHGGLRYLEQFSLGLMRESIRERHTLARLAPGLVRWSPFLLPHFKGKGRLWKYSLGLWLYDLLARTPESLGHQVLDRAQTLECCPALRSEGLAGAALFYDCVTDDARLVLRVVLEAEARGARVCNYAAVEGLIRENGRAVGARVRDALTGESWEVRARQIVIAAGPWTDQILMRLGECPEKKRIRPAKGIHIVLPRARLELNHTVLIPSARDRRFLFVIPWYEGVVVGTTDTEDPGNPDAVRPDLKDVEYVLDAMNWSFPRARVGLNDIISSYAGIRPLINVPGKSTADVPREYKMFEIGSGILSVAGGKLTTYRSMAKLVVDRVIGNLRAKDRGLRAAPSTSHLIKLVSLPESTSGPLDRIELQKEVRDHLLADYGSGALEIASMLERFPQWRRRMVPSLPHIMAEAYYAVTREKARTLEDILARRTRVTLLDPDQGRGCVRGISEIIAPRLGWSPQDVEWQIESYENALRTQFCAPRDLP